MSAAVITTAQASCTPIPLEQVLRYLGCRPSNAPEEVRQLATRAAEAVQRTATCRACWCRLPVTISDEHLVWLGSLRFDSRNLARNLAGCQEAFLFGATIGAGPERLILAGRRLSAADALAADAAGTAAVEQWCDEINARLEALLPRRSAICVRAIPQATATSPLMPNRSWFSCWTCPARSASLLQKPKCCSPPSRLPPWWESVQRLPIVTRPVV